MAQFDVHPTTQGVLVVDCQSDTLSHMGTRIVIPLLTESRAPAPTDRLHPILEVNGKPFVLGTQFLASLPRQELRGAIASVEAERYRILGAIDLLLTGA